MRGTVIGAAFVFALMQTIAPVPPGGAGAFAASIDAVVEETAPPPGWSKDFAKSVMTRTLYDEGRYCLNCKRGDGGRSVCAGQVWGFNEAHKRLLETSPMACARAAYFIVRESAKLCPAHPLAPYCGGCKNPAAVSISDRRMSQASTSLAKIGPSFDLEDEANEEHERPDTTYARRQ